MNVSFLQREHLMLASCGGSHLAITARMRRLVVVSVAAACTASSARGPALQMNDLSVLLPMATTPDELSAYLTPDSPGANGPLLPRALYTSDPNAISFTGLRVVAFRLDPCFAHLGPITDASTCDNQIRLVFQPLVGDATTAPQAFDSGVHVSYALTRDQLLAAVREIAAARAAIDDGDLGPLAVHPIVAREGLNGEMAHELMAIAAKYADGTKIERITSLELQVGGGANGDLGGVLVSWQMHGMKVANGVETPLEIPTLSAGTTSVTIAAAASPFQATLSPETTAADDPDLLMAPDQATAATPAARQAAFDAALRIENPNTNTPDTIDCASCHMAEPARALVGEQVFGLTSAGDANAFRADATIPAADLTATNTLVDPRDAGINIHAFSYRFATPMINQRVINETAAILAYLRPSIATE